MSGVAPRRLLAGRVDRIRGGGPLFGTGGGVGEDLDCTAAAERGGGAGMPVFEPRRGGGGGSEEPCLTGSEGPGVGELEPALLVDAADNAAEEVRLGGGGNGANGFGFVLLFTRLRGGGGGGADCPLYGSQFVFFIGTLRNIISFSNMEQVLHEWHLNTLYCGLEHC